MDTKNILISLVVIAVFLVLGVFGIGNLITTIFDWLTTFFEML